MRSERGTTMTEVLVVLAISALVLPSLYIAVAAGFRQELQQESQQAAEAQIRQVSDRLTEDITEGAPSDKRAGSAESELSLEFTDEKGQVIRVFWTLEDSRLVRLVMDGASGRTISEVTLLENVKVDGPVFRYWTSKGSEITDGRNIASCAVRVTVSLRTVVDGGEASTVFDVTHRTRNLEAEPC